MQTPVSTSATAEAVAKEQRAEAEVHRPSTGEGSLESQQEKIVSNVNSG